MLKYLREEYACYPPDFIWAYSNTAFSLLSEVISRVSGQSFQEYTDALFEKMGMHHSSYFDKPAFEENLARGHFQEEPLERFYDNMWTAGSVLSNVTDMARFIKMVLGQGLVGRSLWGERYKPVSLPVAWSSRLGKYEISNLYPDDCLRYLPKEVQDLGRSVKLALKDVILVLGCTIQDNSLLLVLEPINDTVAKICALGRDKGGAVQVVTVNDKEQIQLWGSLYKKA